MIRRKELKAAGRRVLKKHYWIFVFLCLAAAFIGSEFSGTLEFITINTQETEAADDLTDSGTSGIAISGLTRQYQDILGELLAGDEEQGRAIANEKIQQKIQETEGAKFKVFGRSRGVLSKIVNELTSGGFLVSLTVSLRSIIGSDGTAAAFLIVLSLFLVELVYVFVVNLYRVVMRRMFLEGRCYETVHFHRLLFLLQVKKWFRAALTMGIESLYLLLWDLTIIGGFIKRYSYFMVPFIVAENPGMTAREAITLSRRMMRGHKWECFKMELSFLGWGILSEITFGLSGILYSNPYEIAVFGEYYEKLRSEAKKNGLEYAELLQDVYLFEKPSEEIRREAYRDVWEAEKQEKTPEEALQGIPAFRRFFMKVFGVTLFNGEQEQAFERAQMEDVYFAGAEEAMEGKAYPIRLSPCPPKERKKWIRRINYLRCYSIWSLVMMFFAMSCIGWLWEVSLHLITDGVFVNRGVLHGPWLPIYGSGSVLILVVLYWFRKNPALEFLTAVVLCGCVEYFTSYYLEIMHDGKKWWDYSGYFLNLNGRICAEGLLVFGLGGVAMVYILGPLLDGWIRRIPHRALILSCVVLLGVYGVDQAYSTRYPNEGKGITDYEGACLEYEQIKWNL